jgi:hypothetical protein
MASHRTLAVQTALLVFLTVLQGGHSTLRGTASRGTQDADGPATAKPGDGVGGGPPGARGASGNGRPGRRADFPTDISLPEQGARGQRAIDLLGSRLGDVAAAYGRDATGLADLLLRDGDVRVDTAGRLFVVESLSVVPPLADSVNRTALPASGPRSLDLLDGTVDNLAATFTLHSRPGAARTIYLDFDGATISGTIWNAGTVDPIIAAPYDTDGNLGAFSDAEKAAIQGIWQRVAEDFAPFEVDVTTEEPAPDALYRSSASDNVYGTTVRGCDHTLPLWFCCTSEEIVGASAPHSMVVDWFLEKLRPVMTHTLAQSAKKDVRRQLLLVHTRCSGVFTTRQGTLVW